MRRLTGRRLCRQCQTAFHMVSAPPQPRRDLRPVRRRALSARGRQRGHRTESPAGVRAADRAAAATTIASRNLLATHPGRGRDRRPSAPRSGAAAEAAMIELKSAREVGLMRQAGHILADVMDRLRGRGQAGHVDARDRRGRRGLHPAARGQARLQGVSRLPGHRVHLDQRGSGARHPVGPAARQRGRHRRSGPGVYRGGVLRRLRVHAGDRRGAAAGPAAARRHPGEPRARHQGVPAGPATLRRLARHPAARREPPLLGRARLRRPRHRPGPARGAAGAELRGPGSRPAAAAGDGAGPRADGDDGELGGPDPGRRLDGGDQGRQPGRPLRAHDRHHR